jgi:hypothetical protein
MENCVMKNFLIMLVCLTGNAFLMSALADNVMLTLEVAKLPDNRVRLSGKTNLPPGTKLMLSVQEEIGGGFYGQSSCSVSDKGEFNSEAFGPSGGLKDGRYVAQAMMPIPAVQSSAVKEIIGKNGENLTGSLVKKGELGVTVSKQTEFGIGASPDAAQAERKKQTEIASAELKKKLCIYLEQLLKFKDEPQFKELGFGRGGPYSKWLESVQALRNAPSTGALPLPLDLRAAPGTLLVLGMKYMEKDETEYTRETLPELKETIDYAAYLENKKRNSDPAR